MFGITCSILVSLSLAAPLPQPPEPKPSGEFKTVNLLETIVSYRTEDKKATVFEAFQSLEATHKLRWICNEAAFGKRAVELLQETVIPLGSDDPFEMKDRKLREVLTALLRQLPCENSQAPVYIVRDGYVEITTLQEKVREFYSVPRKAKVEELYAVPLTPLVVYECRDRPLDKVVAELAEQTGYTITLGVDVAKKGHMVTIRLVNVPLDTAVHMLANMYDAQMASMDKLIHLTTPKKATKLQTEWDKIKNNRLPQESSTIP